MLTVTIEEIQRDIATYLHQVEAGETLIVMQAGKPVAEIRPISPTVKRMFGNTERVEKSSGKSA
ncbi:MULTISPECIES: type II toxin-antitoxin system Phd/YefM family antitoxin [Cyanophyceae]|uniref:type II toxin-antitoxin system Phd/YefM family antitoxin n=1 Tax=Cyanophyceae TaxID=3028117 RepID=UPI00168A1042|nr:type II toxin-antitoxin system prevent-host-death family antitoxin [Trichocoleus sp. FACHB-69]MBD1935374.1 type II toxin-antitoxin system prevent-host-death family antitoxin [Trichocoleus sp. FACHB-69]